MNTTAEAERHFQTTINDCAAGKFVAEHATYVVVPFVFSQYGETQHA